MIVFLKWKDIPCIDIYRFYVHINNNRFSQASDRCWTMRVHSLNIFFFLFFYILDLGSVESVVLFVNYYVDFFNG